MKSTLAKGELNRLVKFLDVVEKASAEHGIRIESYTEQWVVVDGDITPYAVVSDDDDPHALSVVVSL